MASEMEFITRISLLSFSTNIQHKHIWFTSFKILKSHQTELIVQHFNFFLNFFFWRIEPLIFNPFFKMKFQLIIFPPAIFLWDVEKVHVSNLLIFHSIFLYISCPFAYNFILFTGKRQPTDVVTIFTSDVK